MGHHHHHHHDADTSGLQVAFFLNLGFTLAEIVGGLAINSVAVLSDALHDLGDSVSLGLAWFLANYAEREGDNKFSYGYRRFSLLGAFLNAVILVAGSLFILSEAIPRLQDPEEFNVPGLIIFALAGIAVNGAAVLRLRGSETANAQVVGWHLLEDVLGWAAVLVVGIVSLFVDLPILDPVLSVLITLYVLANVLGNLRRIVELFLQAVPGEADLDTIAARLAALDGVVTTHHVHLWSLDGEHHVLSAHLVVAPQVTLADTRRIKCESKAALDALDLQLEHITLEVEFDDEDCSMGPGNHAP
jgi:cobalt-zinc-cadmium efflux system protein